jgi:autotransporter strand-loop-strand O-heptosyltransferase
MGEIVNIRFDAFGLGDNIAWIPYAEEYRKHTGKSVLVSTFYNRLFAPVYPELVFCEPNNQLFNIEKIMIGVGENDKEWRTKPLQKVASDALGLEYTPIQPKVAHKEAEIPYENYVCISEHSTRDFKEWRKSGGWQAVVDYLNEKGIKTVVCSKERTFLRDVIDCTGERPLINRATLLKNAKMFLGVSSGLAWLSWAMDTPVIMISGATMDWHEFPCHRIINKDVCHGCINDHTDRKFDKNFKCIRKSFECSEQISEKDVIIKIDEILKGECNE